MWQCTLYLSRSDCQNFLFNLAYPSSDGKAWTLTNRAGFYINKIEKGVYYRVMVDSPEGRFPWMVGNTGQATCYVGVIDGHWPNLAECLGENYVNNGLRCTTCW